MRRPALIAVVLAAALSLAGSAAAGVGNPNVAAAQVGLRLHGLYGGTVDGLSGPATSASVRALQQRAHLAADGAFGPRTRAALGEYGRHRLGSRVLMIGAAGWDVAGLQFLLAWHGFPSGPFDGHLADRSERALRRYQRWAGLTADGAAGPAVIASLRSAPPRSPIPLSRPVAGPLGDLFGPRGDRFHAGLDFPAAFGVPVAAAASGRVAYASWQADWGNVVTIAHSNGVRTMYAHLSRIGARIGQTVSRGSVVGWVGATGHATGPHLHFEVRLRGAAVDPLPALR
jgi:murein DD-endopeptidase MepM/ murein hydrolase activator NlpD